MDMQKFCYFIQKIACPFFFEKLKDFEYILLNLLLLDKENGI